MSEETRWKVLLMAKERNEVPLAAAIEWLNEDPENESDDAETAYNQMVSDLHPESDM